MRGWIVLAVALAGCAAPAVWHQGGVQCEPMPWDGGQTGGADEEQLTRLVSYYQAKGVDVVDARIVDHEVGVPAVCGAWTGRDYEIEVAGDFPQVETDGWRPGPAQPPRSE